jgi:hypothetical protein
VIQFHAARKPTLGEEAQLGDDELVELPTSRHVSVGSTAESARHALTQYAPLLDTAASRQLGQAAKSSSSATGLLVKLAFTRHRSRTLSFTYFGVYCGVLIRAAIHSFAHLHSSHTSCATARQSGQSPNLDHSRRPCLRVSRARHHFQATFPHLLRSRGDSRGTNK